jgi:hypothetical protein
MNFDRLRIMTLSEARVVQMNAMKVFPPSKVKLLDELEIDSALH